MTAPSDGQFRHHRKLCIAHEGEGGGEGGKGEVIYMTFPLFFVHPLFKGRLMYLPNGPLMADTKIAALPCPIREDAAQSGSPP